MLTLAEKRKRNEGRAEANSIYEEHKQRHKYNLMQNTKL